MYKSIFVGGVICTMGQGLQWMFITYFNYNEKTAGAPTTITLIFLAVMLTGFGVYDHIGQWAGAGTAVPVTGFANSIASAAIEHRSEGCVLGVAGNMFRLAGASIPISSFGNALVKGALTDAEKTGFIGVFTGVFKMASAGISSAIVFGFIAAIIFKPKG